MTARGERFGFRRRGGFALLGLGALILGATDSPAQPPGPKPPVYRKMEKPHEEVLHGEKWVDFYYDLRDKKSPKVKQYLEAENAYAAAVMKPTAPLQETLFKEFLAHTKENDDTVPVRRGGFFYSSRTEKGKQYPIYRRTPDKPNAREEILLDVNELAKGHKYCAVGEQEVSDDGNLLAYTVDTTGFREYDLRVKDLRTGELLPDRIEKIVACVWAADNKTLFYTTEDDAKRAYRLHRHKLGDPVGKDALLFEEKDPLYDVRPTRSRDGKYLFLTSTSYTTTEVRYLKRDRPDDDLKVLLKRRDGHRYYAEHRDGRFYLRTNQDAKNFRLVTAPVATPEKWQELVPHRFDAMLANVNVFKDHLVLHERYDGLDRLVVFNPETKTHKKVRFDEATYALAEHGTLAANPEFDATTFRFAYQSFTTPYTVFEYDLATGARKEIKKKDAPNYDARKYHVERIFATAEDGTEIPISLVYDKAKVKKDGSAPLWLHGYGAYGSTRPATFSEARLSLLDRGVIYAIAHVRGGGELGEPWHDDGKMMKKVNSFTDFIACAEYLIAQKYTTKDKLAIQGRSAGGLLMGGVVMRRPDLARVAVVEVPFLDVVGTMIDTTVPLTAPEFLEWGDPRGNPDHYRYMKSYCPITNLKADKYPAMLVTAYFNDSQVMYWEPAKYVAKLRPLKQDDRPLVFNCVMDGGHGGASGRYDWLREQAYIYAFVLTQLGVEK